MRGLKSAFVYFGGLSAEFLFDQMTSVIIDNQRTKGGALFRSSSASPEHWRFTIRPAGRTL